MRLKMNLNQTYAHIVWAHGLIMCTYVFAHHISNEPTERQTTLWRGGMTRPRFHKEIGDGKSEKHRPIHIA